MSPYVKLPPRVVNASCRTCSDPFSYVKAGPGRTKQFCSQKCARLGGRRKQLSRSCAHCAEPFFPVHGKAKPGKGRPNIFCSQACYHASTVDPVRKAETRRVDASRRRAIKKGATVEKFTHREVYERDRWRCGLCGKKVDKKLAYPDPMSASLDHIVPLCDGGEHSLRNTQCSHWICNSRKTFGPGGQMRLFG